MNDQVNLLYAAAFLCGVFLAGMVMVTLVEVVREYRRTRAEEMERFLSELEEDSIFKE